MDVVNTIITCIAVCICVASAVTLLTFWFCIWKGTRIVSSLARGRIQISMSDVVPFVTSQITIIGVAGVVSATFLCVRFLF